MSVVCVRDLTTVRTYKYNLGGTPSDLCQDTQKTLPLSCTRLSNIFIHNPFSSRLKPASSKSDFTIGAPMDPPVELG